MRELHESITQTEKRIIAENAKRDDAKAEALAYKKIGDHR